MKFKQSINIDWLGILGITALCLLSRLPQLMSPYFHADEDECILGLMANHIAFAKDFPFYFWGQSYGFSWIEAGAVALAIKFFGIGIFSLKVPMLLLWTTGCVFFYCALAQWTTKIHSFLITCLLILSPAWMSWSMKARGGYITAFLLSNIVLFLLARNWQSLNNKVCLWIGILLGFIYLSQPVSLLGVMPLLIWAISKNKNFKTILICVAGFTGIFILGKIMAHLQSNTDFWNPVWFRPESFLTVISSLKERIFNALMQDSGIYSLGRSWASVIVVNAWCAVLLVNCGIYIFMLITKKASTLSTSLLISVLLILVCVFFIGREYRYLLSLSMFLVLWFGILSFEWMNGNILLKTVQGFVLGSFIILGFFVAWNYKDFYRSVPAPSNEVPEMQKVSQMIKFLKASDVKYVFSLDNDMGWKILFFSGERIIARWENVASRQPAYSKAVDQAYLNGQEKQTAVIGNILAEPFAYIIVAQEGNTPFFGGEYFAHLAPSKELITNKLEFQLEQPLH